MLRVLSRKRPESQCPLQENSLICSHQIPTYKSKHKHNNDTQSRNKLALGDAYPNHSTCIFNSFLAIQFSVSATYFALGCQGLINNMTVKRTQKGEENSAKKSLCLDTCYNGNKRCNIFSPSMEVSVNWLLSTSRVLVTVDKACQMNFMSN